MDQDDFKFVQVKTLREESCRLARDLLSLADSAEMPDECWRSDSRIRHARKVLGVSENGRYTQAHLWS